MRIAIVGMIYNLAVPRFAFLRIYSLASLMLLDLATQWATLSEADMPGKSVNPLLPFVVCATSVFAEEVEATIDDEEFKWALTAMAQIEHRVGRAAFERIMAKVARSVSKAAWAQLFRAADATCAQCDTNGAPLH